MTEDRLLRPETARWFLRGARNMISIPALVLLAAMVGFTALARDAGYTLAETLFLTVTVWALPGQVVFVGMVGSGAALPAVVLAVALSGMRFLPMVVAWTPMVRGPRTSRLTLLALSSFVAVTAWVFAVARLPDVPRSARAPYFAGFGVSLVSATAVVMALAYELMGDLPGFPAAALVFLTPVYFLIALWGAARDASDKAALAAGLVLGPVFTILVPEADILLAGVIGGTLAWAGARATRRRS